VIHSPLLPLEYKKFFITRSVNNRRRNLDNCLSTPVRLTIINYPTYRRDRPRFTIDGIEKIVRWHWAYGLQWRWSSIPKGRRGLDSRMRERSRLGTRVMHSDEQRPATTTDDDGDDRRHEAECVAFVFGCVRTCSPLAPI